MNPNVWGVLTLISFIAELAFGAGAFIFVQRLLKREWSPVSEEVGSFGKVLGKVRKKEPMSPEELDYARQAISDRGSPLALCIPAAIFTIGCIYVFGSFYQLHGRDPSIRTYIGLIPMLAGFNLAMQLLRIAVLKRRLPKTSAA